MGGVEMLVCLTLTSLVVLCFDTMHPKGSNSMLINTFLLGIQSKSIKTF